MRVFIALSLFIFHFSLMAQNQKIVGGSAIVRAPSWIVRIHKDNETFCTGSLIAPDTVLTAAHCHLGWMDGSINRVKLTVGNSNMNLLFGETRSIAEIRFALNTTDIMAASYEDVGRFVLNGYDHLIIKLNAPVRAAPIRLATPQEIKSFENINSRPKPFAIGFGTTTEYATNPAKVLQMASGLNLLNPSECLNKTDYSQLMCVTSPTNMICRGDSGGPLVVMTKSGLAQIGVASFISPRGPSLPFTICTPSTTMGTYSSISVNYAWINQQTN